MSSIYYKRMSESGAHRSVYVYSRTASSIKSAIGGQMGLLSTSLSLVEGQTVMLKDTDVAANSTVEVVHHPSHRTVPSVFNTSSTCVIDGEYADEARVRMSCGHGITSENLFKSALNQLQKGKTSLTCVSCALIWNLSHVFERGSLSIDEKIFLSRKINRNVISKDDNIRECPSCSSLCERSNIYSNQVSCTYCLCAGRSPYSFCWKCSKPWIGSHACYTAEAIRTLSSCELVTMGYSNIPNVPKVRSCPKCHVLLEHTGGCKTMTCPSPCRYVFCFSCLKSKDGRNLSCGSYESKCDPAPRQNII